MTMQRTAAFPSLTARWFGLFALLFAGTALLFASAAMAQQQSAVATATATAQDPPARVGTLTASEGSVMFAPPGETEWTEVPRNRPITRGDRLWTDDGARAELHFGSAVVHMDGRTFLEVVSVDDDVLQLRVNEGVVNARVREMRGGDTVQIDTPQLALRVTEPGEWRMDVDAQHATTRVAIRSGSAVLYGEGSRAQHLAAGQQMAFAGRDLAQAGNVAALGTEAFERWAIDRNRAEDQSIAARYVPRDVVGYQELDQSGTWSQDPTYGAVWYPTVAAADWAPYRYGRWEWIAPWGWTWIDDAPWGFAPFHYGRWATIGSRWAWVPGPLGRRPVYAPALVAFVGGSNVSFSFSSGPGIGWYPLAPGEIWQPFYAASPVYIRNVNRYVVTSSRYYNTGTHYFLRRPEAITAVRIDDFNRGRPVQGRWSRVNFSDASRVQAFAPPTPSREFRREQREQYVRSAASPVQRWSHPALAGATQAAPQPRALFQPPVERRDIAQERGLQQQREQQVREQQRQQQREQPARDQAVQRQQLWRQQQAQQQAQREQHREPRAWAAQAQQQAQQRREQAQHQAQSQQHAWAPQQQRDAGQQHRQVQQQVQQQRHEERSAQRSAQHQAQGEGEGRGQGRGRRWE